MITLRCTQKLRKYLGIVPVDIPEPSTAMLGDWYVNLVPKGAYGDVSRDSHMREVEGQEAECLSFFMYEEIHAFREAAEGAGLSREDIEDVFCANARKLLQDAGTRQN